MNKFYLSEIYIYPIKSLGGISVNECLIEKKGLQYDRRWVLIDKEGTFITQRKYPLLALLQVSIVEDKIIVSHKENPNNSTSFDILQHKAKLIPVAIWDDLTSGFEVNNLVSAWFSDYMNMPVKLVKMSEQEKRMVDPRYAMNNEIVSFADGYPCLLIGQSSLDNLNKKLEIPIYMDRFRPNFVFTGGEAHVEDSFKDFELSGVLFSAVKPCSRCVLITINQQTGIKSSEPLKTLSKYRTTNNKIMFGQNLIHQVSGIIHVGDELRTCLKFI
ncbi:MOSC domain-containing protein [Pedobacter mendelii]|uniref:MOSC domain-containing protein n=1 Tax=Pedobacter mendelii TaxID=1908240 RepID=A0ABQ2BG28_9SPHI|nr:MOSC N-terminal beta barrel domain-containing protein [Pedobacter mendelii]GGI25378.1 MOSC domain-containing protein [Pedobacter mendelii]